MRVGVLAVSCTVLHPALSSLDEFRRISFGFSEEFPTGQSYLWPVFYAVLTCILFTDFALVLPQILPRALPQGAFSFSPATRFIAGRVAAVRFPTKRVFSSLSAAFAITLSFFRDRRFTVYKRKLRDK